MHPVKIMSEYENDYRFVRKFFGPLEKIDPGAG
jgi:hypothetical protein